VIRRVHGCASLLSRGLAPLQPWPAACFAASHGDIIAGADNILTSAGGASIRQLRSADMGIINVNPANSTETSAQGNNDTESLEKDIITIVHVTYDLK
jgi:hypothetical protein